MPIHNTKNMKAITQWQLGEWIALKDNTQDDTLKLAAHLEMGDFQITQDGSYQQASKHEKAALLISAIHNGLGRSALLMGKQEEAKEHFQQALQNGPYPGDSQLLTPLRMAHQASQLGLNLNHLTGLQLHLSQENQLREKQTPQVKQLYQFLDQLLSQLATQGRNMELDGMPVFNGKDPFMAGKTIMALAYWVTEYQAGDPLTGERAHQARKIIRLLENEKSTSWGVYFYLKGLRQLQTAGLLDACFSINHLIQLKEELHWNTFVDPKTFQLKNKPTNFYQVAYAIAQLRFQLGWESAAASYELLSALQNHYEEVSGECGFADETQGKGRYDRYSFLFVAEIAHRMREAGLPLPKNLKENLRKSADYVLINLNEEGDGFQYGRSIGAYGDSAFLEILTAAAWYELLTEEELKAAHYFSQRCTQKFTNYWWDAKRGTVNLWEDGRVTDGYRGKHRILGENFSLIYQHLYTQGIWQQLGYSQELLSQEAYKEWLCKLPKATLTWFHEGEAGDYQQAEFTFRDQSHIFNLPLVNGDLYSKQSVYLPIPYSSLGIQGQPDIEQPLLTPAVQTLSGEAYWAISHFEGIQLKEAAEGYTLSWKQNLHENLKITTSYLFKQGLIERVDILETKVNNLQNVVMAYPEKISKKLSFQGYQENKKKSVIYTPPSKPKDQHKLGWSLTF